MGGGVSPRLGTTRNPSGEGPTKPPEVRFVELRQRRSRAPDAGRDALLAMLEVAESHLHEPRLQKAPENGAPG